MRQIRPNGNGDGYSHNIYVGKVKMSGCKLVQSETASNGVMVAIGEEGAYDETEFWSENNTFVNKREEGGQEVVLRCRPRK